MSRKRRRNRDKRRPVPVPIASMGDIAFLLIIFFIMVSEATKDKNVDLDLPVDARVQKVNVQFAARIAMDRDGRIFFDSDEVQNAKDVEYALKAILDDTESEDQRHVQFKCHNSLTKSQFEPVIQAIAEAGGIIQAVADKPAQDK